MVMLANDSNYKEEKIVIEEKAPEVEVPEDNMFDVPLTEQDKMSPLVEKNTFSVSNMKAVAKKMRTPGFIGHEEEGGEDEEESGDDKEGDK